MKWAEDLKARHHTSSQHALRQRIKDRQVQQNDKSRDVGDKQIRATIIIKPHQYNTKYKKERKRWVEQETNKRRENWFDTLSAQMMGDWTSKSTLWSPWWWEDSRTQGFVPLICCTDSERLNVTELNPTTIPWENHYWQQAPSAQPLHNYNYIIFFYYTTIFLLNFTYLNPIERI